LCAVQRGKGTGHPTPFNSSQWWYGVCCAWACVHACMHVYLVLALYEDPISLWADNCTHTHTHTELCGGQTLRS